MYAPGGFDATIEKWRALNVYARIKLLDHLPQRYTCVAFDRRECGESGGRVEPVSWKSYANQGKGLLDHLGIAAAYLIGGCMGCSNAIAFAAHKPETVLGMILWWPVGGAKYRAKGLQRFAEHAEFVKANGLEAVVELVRREGKSFGADPRGGPWAAPIRTSPAFAADYARRDMAGYIGIVEAMAQALLDRDTAPGAEPEELQGFDIPTLVIPGNDDSHATSAARYLAAQIPNAEYWDVAVEDQGEHNAPARLLEFLDRNSRRVAA
jgi:pimeloyl-ACP methyl ester carboxylesterase